MDLRVSDESADVEGDPKSRAKPKKAPNAFRTISEVADELHIPQHVLRFWETKFPQVKPLKRGGGRRYYRPDDIDLLRRIADLLYTQGYTIKGVQRLLREGGGTLSDDIPPPSPEERAALAGAEDPPPLFLDLELTPPPAPESARSMPRPRPETEEQRLRKALQHVLGELDAIKAMLRQIGQGN
jgi:DNA-binding transcriptional MerR regulator